MPKKKEGILDYLDSYAFQILKSLKDAETAYSELMKKSELVRSNFNRRLGELLRLKLIKVAYDEEKRKPYYSLTTVGERIVDLMEEIDNSYTGNSTYCKFKVCRYR